MNATKTGHSRIHTHTEGGLGRKMEEKKKKKKEGSKRIDDELYMSGAK